MLWKCRFWFKLKDSCKTVSYTSYECLCRDSEGASEAKGVKAVVALNGAGDMYPVYVGMLATGGYVNRSNVCLIGRYSVRKGFRALV